MNQFAWVIDDHQLFNAGISRLLVGLSGIDEVLSFASPQEAFDTDASVAPSLIIADYFIPGFNIEDWMPKLSSLYPTSPIVVISSSISTLDKKRCLQWGAHAYFEKHLEPDAVLSGLQQVLDDTYKQGNTENNIAMRLAGNILTNRQVEILICLARGSSLKLMADELGVSTETVKTHLSNLYRNINVSSKDDAILWAREHGLV